MWPWLMAGCLASAAACGFPRPTPLGGMDDAGAPPGGCAANQALRCSGNDLVRCNAEGTAELTETCAVGCNNTSLRCNDINPSNGMAGFLDLAAAEPDIDLGTSATINTLDGTVTVDGKPVMVRSTLLAQTSAPTILVFIVRRLTANDVTIDGGAAGTNAFALVSDGEIKIGGIFSASGLNTQPGAGAYNDANCKGGDGAQRSSAFGGGGGGGFGSPGGNGGSATDDADSAAGGKGGGVAGNATLLPLRGGCNGGSGNGSSTSAGGGGGAIQLVSRTRITVTGVVAANGSPLTGGGSGGGILLEAPVVDVTGSLVANGAGGASGCLFSGPGEPGRLDGTPARGGTGCPPIAGSGGRGAAGATSAEDGENINDAGMNQTVATGGNGGGGVGRIRINTAAGGFHRAGLFSPNPSTGAIATR